MISDNVLLKTAEIAKSYMIGQSRQQVLAGVNLEVRQGEFLAIMGASGSGKSTLLHILGLLDRPDSGQYQFDNQDIYRLPAGKLNRMRNRDFGFVFQFYHLLPELNVLENIMLPVMVGCPALKWPVEKARFMPRGRELLHSIGLSDRSGQKPTTLSGGERQRVALARALICRPRVLLADEPTGNLDSKAGSAILNMMLELNRSGQTIVMVTHDSLIAQKAHRTVHLIDGKIN